MNTEITRFNVRIYLLIIDELTDSVLISDELIKGKPYMKFPGGGLEYGESLIDCARREAMEELGQELEDIEHFYTTDFFVQSAFKKTDQVISIFYSAKISGPQKFRTTNKKFDFRQDINDEESFRWVPVEALSVDEFDFPADKEAARKLLTRD